MVKLLHVRSYFCEDVHPLVYVFDECLKSNVGAKVSNLDGICLLRHENSLILEYRDEVPVGALVQIKVEVVNHFDLLLN